MGLLDDLKREADKAREAKDAEEARQAKLRQIYRAEIAPRLSKIYHYLAEMISHLEEANWVVETDFEFPGLGKVEGLRQGNYRIYIDSQESPKKVTLQCECTLPEERKFSVYLEKANDLRLFLLANKVVFTEWPVRDGNGQIKTLTFQTKLKAQAGLLFEPDIESSRIRVVSQNFEGLRVREYMFAYSPVDEAWLDDLGHYLLRKKGVLGYLEMPEEARRRLQQLAELEKARQMRVGQEGVSDKEKKSGEPGLLRGLRSLFKPDKPD